MTSSHYAPYVLGDTRATMGTTMGSQPARVSKSQKGTPSADWGLQLDPMKMESVVIAGQPYRGECVLGPCTHRPSHQPSGQHPKSYHLRYAQGVTRKGGEVVTR